MNNRYTYTKGVFWTAKWGDVSKFFFLGVFTLQNLGDFNLLRLRSSSFPIWNAVRSFHKRPHEQISGTFVWIEAQARQFDLNKSITRVFMNICTYIYHTFMYNNNL